MHACEEFECLYLSEALPSCGCVCQGDKLFLHLINPFFNPAGQSNAHNQSCNWHVTERHHRRFRSKIKLSIKLPYICHLTSPSTHNTASKQTRLKRIIGAGQAKREPIKLQSQATNAISSNKTRVTACQPIRLLSESSNVKSTNQISVTQSCDWRHWCEAGEEVEGGQDRSSLLIGSTLTVSWM